MRSFKQWLLREGEDIFGFEKRGKKPIESTGANDKPIVDLHSEIVVEYMMAQKVEGLEPVLEFCNHLRWGKGHGAVEMVISPLGSYKSIIRRQQPDLEGKPIWVCQRIIPYKEYLESNEKIDQQLGFILTEEVEKVLKKQTDAPSHEYKELRSLTQKVIRSFQRKDVLPVPFIYVGTREAEAGKKYLISFELRGHGVEAPGSARVEQFTAELHYNPSTGMIRSFGYEIQSPTRGHTWYPQPSEWDEYFSSGQKHSEIIECLESALSTY